MTTDNVPVLYDVLTACLRGLLTTRLDHFNHVNELYKQRRNIRRPLGFEALVIAELYALLGKELRDNVFLDFPSGRSQRIDLALLREGSLGLVELKMYQSDTRNAYGSDFRKLRAIVDTDATVLGILIHFHFYMNRNRPAQKLFQELYASLPEERYWRSLDIVGNPMDQHLLVLGFRREG